MNNQSYIYDKLMREFYNPIGVCALIGNLYAESGLKANNLQNSGNARLGLTDEEYTLKVDNNTYTNFVNDRNGYGLAQWTSVGRKQNLLNFARSKNKSIGDLDMQLDFLIEELKVYKSVYNSIKYANDIKTCSDVIVKQYERPANQTEPNLLKRASFGLNFYNELVPAYKDNNTIYKVVKGDTLWRIAKKFYGSGLKFNKIMKDNNLTSTVIEIGQELIIKGV